MKTSAALNLEPIFREIARDEITRILEEKQRKGKQPEYITLDQAREEYHLFGATLYRKIKAETLRLYALGGKSLLKRSEVEALIKQCPPRKRPRPPKGQQHWKSKAKKAKAEGKPEASQSDIPGNQK